MTREILVNTFRKERSSKKLLQLQRDRNYTVCQTLSGNTIKERGGLRCVPRPELIPAVKHTKGVQGNKEVLAMRIYTAKKGNKSPA